MRAGILGVALVGMAAGSWACGGGSDGLPDAADSGGDDGPGPDGSIDPMTDGGGATAGLRLTFGSDPTLPGALGGDPFSAYIEEVRVELKDLRAVGDSETGENTSRPSLSLRWGSEDDDDEEEDESLRRSGIEDEGDIEVQFPTAPPGYYSLIKADIMSYQARGTVDVRGGTRFKIEDSPPTPISITLALDDLLLEAGTIRTVSIHCSLHEVVGDVPWDQVEAGTDDDIEIESGDPETAGLRDAMGRAFTAAVIGEVVQ